MYNYFNGEGTIGFICDSCGRELNGCSIVNGMKFCAKCYQETFGKDNQQNEIQQLKQQLEEKDNYHLRYELAGADETITNLKKQIEEKDKEIEKLNKTLEMCKHIERYDIGEMFLENAKLIIEKRQFAIQELEKVKVSLKDRISMMKNEEHSYLQKVVTWYDICDQINNQIKELKGE